MTEAPKPPNHALNELAVHPAIQQARDDFASANPAGREAVVTNLGKTIMAAVMPHMTAGAEYTSVLPLMAAQHELALALPDGPFKTTVQQRGVANVESVYYSVMNDKTADPLKAAPVIELQRTMAMALPDGDFRNAKLAWAPKFMRELADRVAKTDPAAAAPLRQRQVELAIAAAPPAAAKPKPPGGPV